MDVADVLQDLISQILNQRRDVIILATRQRSKFEHWLKFELAAILTSRNEIENIRIEDPFPKSKKRSDLSFRAENNTWYVELKTSNTNWRAQGVENRTRPITRNITSIIVDIQKLRQNCPPAKGIAAFILFPIPARIWNTERDRLLFQLHRIERECQLPNNELSNHATYIPTDVEFGLLVFIVEAI